MLHGGAIDTFGVWVWVNALAVWHRRQLGASIARRFGVVFLSSRPVRRFTKILLWCISPITLLADIYGYFFMKCCGMPRLVSQLLAIVATEKELFRGYCIFLRVAVEALRPAAAAAAAIMSVAGVATIKTNEHVEQQVSIAVDIRLYDSFFSGILCFFQGTYVCLASLLIIIKACMSVLIAWPVCSLCITILLIAVSSSRPSPA